MKIRTLLFLTGLLLFPAWMHVQVAQAAPVKKDIGVAVLAPNQISMPAIEASIHRQLAIAQVTTEPDSTNIDEEGNVSVSEDCADLACQIDQPVKEKVSPQVAALDSANFQTANQNSPEPAKFSWTQLRHTDLDNKPHHLTPNKTKRYLKRFVRNNYTDLSAALVARQEGKRLTIGQRRLLTSYDSLCQWYKDTHPQEQLPLPESFL